MTTSQMTIDLSDNSLYSNSGELIKTFECPLSKSWELLSLTKNQLVRFCADCRNDVINITQFDEKEIIALFKVNHSACAYINFPKAKAEFSFRNSSPDETKCIETVNNLPVIQTARDIEAINIAIKAGSKVLIKPTDPNSAPQSKVGIYHNKNGELTIEGYDLRHFDWKNSQTTYYKSGQNFSPFAAYIIPRNFPNNVKVYIPDVIEHVIDSSWNQGDTFRLNSTTGFWNGEEIIIDKPEPMIMVG
ncbi:hypothetical protein Q4575_04785 [Psychrosphaera sp. 1_MG-2023]|uniref:hypothetical protein n=1 Tax=Psychrosphaera sp. 1_MG-2023 TaxID=3062643 RepID=UPI0026E4865F|nr:hypothetical protein [Psychrosphaera sp. 1_MG-2023]MDO6718703.1 hypothetical protein [Psychrosphaera sp. 1_MG-2023]